MKIEGSCKEIQVLWFRAPNTGFIQGLRFNGFDSIQSIHSLFENDGMNRSILSISAPELLLEFSSIRSTLFLIRSMHPTDSVGTDFILSGTQLARLVTWYQFNFEWYSITPIGAN